MIIRKGYRFKLTPTAAQAELFARFSGSGRFVWNKALELQKKALDTKQKCLNYAEVCKLLTGWKTEFQFLKEVHSQPLQQSLKDLLLAWAPGVAGNKGLPKFKKRGKHDSFRFPQGVKLNEKKLYLPKIGWVKFRKSQEIEGEIKNVTVSRSQSSWFVSLQVEKLVEEPIHPSTKEAGIDLGIIRFATISDGTFFAPVSSFVRNKQKLARAQCKLSKKQKFSNNWKKQLAKVQRIHTKIANVRRDYLHKTTTEISKNHAFVVLENLKIKNMSASAKGTIDEPGKNVMAKSGLNRSILDQGWYEFRRQLEYKQKWRGGQVIAVSPAYTSLKCSKCHHQAKENRKEQAVFICVQCGYRDHADVNAAKNILAAGQAVRACGDIEQTAA